MATVYLRSTDGSDADDGSTWALADATLAASVTAAGAGGRSYVSDNHAESQATAMTIANPGTAASPNEVLCSDDAAEPPTALATTGTVTTTGNNAISITGFSYFYGLTFHSGSGASGAAFINLLASAAAGALRFDNCTLRIGTTNVNTFIQVGVTSSNLDDMLVEWINTTCQFNGATVGIRNLGARLRWRGGSVTGTVPTTLFGGSLSNSVGPDVIVDGVDLSAIGSGKNLVGVNDAVKGSYLFRNCKLGSSVSITTGTHAGPGGVEVTLINCDSTDTNYRYYKQTYEGTITQETTIVRTGGATDGTTPVSRKMVSSANTKLYQPLVYEIMFWNESTSALSLACEVVSDGVTFTNAELWMEVEALTNSGFPYSSFTSDRATTILTSAANQTSSSVAWTTTGLASPTKQKLEVSVTPAEKGWVRCRIYLAKASSTVYVCPLITGLGFTSGRQWQTADAYVLEGASSGSGGGGPLIGGRLVGR